MGPASPALTLRAQSTSRSPRCPALNPNPVVVQNAKHRPEREVTALSGRCGIIRLDPDLGRDGGYVETLLAESENDP